MNFAVQLRNTKNGLQRDRFSLKPNKLSLAVAAEHTVDLM